MKKEPRSAVGKRGSGATTGFAALVQQPDDTPNHKEKPCTHKLQPAPRHVHPSTFSRLPRSTLACSYAMIPKRAVLELAPGPLVTLAILASLRRKTRWLTLSSADLATSTGFCARTVSTHKRELERRGYLQPGTHVLTELAMPGRLFARVDIVRWPVLGAAACRVLAAVALFTDRRGRLRVPRSRLADLLSCTTRTIRRGLVAAREAGIRIATPFSRGGKYCPVPPADVVRHIIKGREGAPYGAPLPS